MVVKHDNKIVVRAIIIEKNGKVLLGKRQEESGRNQYAIIGGEPHKNENPEHTIIREVKEETGLIFENPIFWKEIVDKKSIPGEIWRILFFYGQASGKLKFQDEEITDVIYVSKKDLSSIDVAFNHREVLTQFFNEIV